MGVSRGSSTGESKANFSVDPIGLWPKSLKTIEDQFAEAGVSEDEARCTLTDNALSFFGLSQAALPRQLIDEVSGRTLPPGRFE